MAWDCAQSTFVTRCHLKLAAARFEAQHKDTALLSRRHSKAQEHRTAGLFSAFSNLLAMVISKSSKSLPVCVWVPGGVLVCETSCNRTLAATGWPRLQWQCAAALHVAGMRTSLCATASTHRQSRQSRWRESAQGALR